MLHSRRLYLGLAVSVLFLALLLWQVDFDELRMSLRDVDPLWLLPAIPAYALALWFRALRWRTLLKPSIDIGSRDVFELMVIGLAANNILPVRAGELIRAGLLQRQHGGRWTIGFGTILVERVLDGLVLAAMLAVTIAFAGGTALLGLVAVLAGVAFVFATALLVALALRPSLIVAFARRLIGLLPARVRPMLVGWVAGFIEGMTTLSGRRAWFVVVFYTTASWLAEAAVYWSVGVGFGLDVPVYIYPAAVAASNLALAAPSTAAGVGPYEYFTREVIVAHGATTGAGTVYAIALHALIVIPLIVAGLVVLWRRGLGFRTLVDVPAPTTAPPS